MNVCVRTCALQQRQGMSLTPFSDFHPHQTLALMPSVTWLVKTKPWCALDVLLPPICCPANEVVTLICHHPRLFWLTFPFTDWNHTQKGGHWDQLWSLSFVFTHSWWQTYNNAKNLISMAVGFGNLIIAACWMLFPVCDWLSDGFCWALVVSRKVLRLVFGFCRE